MQSPFLWDQRSKHFLWAYCEAQKKKVYWVNKLILKSILNNHIQKTTPYKLLFSILLKPRTFKVPEQTHGISIFRLLSSS